MKRWIPWLCFVLFLATPDLFAAKQAVVDTVTIEGPGQCTLVIPPDYPEYTYSYSCTGTWHTEGELDEEKEEEEPEFEVEYSWSAGGCEIVGSNTGSGVAVKFRAGNSGNASVSCTYSVVCKSGAGSGGSKSASKTIYLPVWDTYHDIGMYVEGATISPGTRKAVALGGSLACSVTPSSTWEYDRRQSASITTPLDAIVSSGSPYWQCSSGNFQSSGIGTSVTWLAPETPAKGVRLKVFFDDVPYPKPENEEGTTDDGPAEAGEVIVDVVIIDRLECKEVTSRTNNPGDDETVYLPVGFNDGAVAVKAFPDSTVGWPYEKPAWSGDIQSSSGGTATVDTTTPGIKTVAAECGNSMAIKICVLEVNLYIWNGGSDLDNGQDIGTQGTQVEDAEEETVGAYLLVNWDDDDADGVMNTDGSWSTPPMPDLEETSVANEDNLAKIQATVQPLLDIGTVEFELSGVDAGKVKLWTQSSKGTQITMNSNKKTWNLAVPTEKADLQTFMTNGFWIEGVAPGTTERGIAFTLRYKDSNGTEICKDDTKATVVMINLANAVYRDNMIWTQTARGHSAIVWKFDGPLTRENLSDDTKFKIVEMQGPTQNKTLATITKDKQYPARGCYSSKCLKPVERLKILKTALSIPTGMGYPTLGGNVLEPKNTWDGNLNTVTHLRCDGLVEMPYEINGVNVWGMKRIPDSSTVHYNICDQVDNWDYNPVTGTWASGSNNECDNQEEHNDFDFTVWFVGDWDDTLMPATQAGYVTPDSASTNFSSQDLCLPIGSKGGN